MQKNILSKEKQYALIKKYQNGNQKALEQLLAANQGFVTSIAKKYFSWFRSRIQNVADLDDFISEANIGLMTCIKKFDCNKNVEFSTYASIWIEQKCRIFAKSIYSSIRVPIGTFDKLIKHKIYESCGIELPEVSDRELSASKVLNVGSLNYRVGENEDEELVDMIADADNLTPESSYIRKENRDILQDAIDRYLSEKEGYIIKQRNNWDRLMDKAKTLQELSDEFHCTRERIRQIEVCANRKLRLKLADHKQDLLC